MEGLHINGMVGVRQQGAKWKVGGTPKPLPHNGLYASARSRTPSPVLVYTPGSRAQTLIPEVALEDGGPRAMGTAAALPRAYLPAHGVAWAWFVVPAADPPMHDGGERLGGGGHRGHEAAEEAHGHDDRGNGDEETAAARPEQRNIRVGKMFPQARRRAMRRILRQEADAAARGDTMGWATGP
mmetsp:Transcript_11697/g.33387  ORF Transcript_11697/g.33387 Transcript_11697/m.33387 type:complete len:183 (-) Transcript_11697:292-840(-)